MAKLLDSSIKICVFIIAFVSPLIFFTDLTQNPYQIQIFLSSVGALFLLFVLSLQFFKKGEYSFLFSKTDIAFLSFFAVALISLAINYFISPTPKALLNEFWRRGYIIISAMFGGYFAARLFCNTETFLNLSEEENCKKGIIFFIWGIFWLPFAYFRMEGLFDIYGLLMWGGAFCLGIKFLEKINLHKILDLLLITGTLAGVYAICQNLGYEFLLPKGIGIDQNFGSNAFSTFGNPNFLSSFIVLVLPVGIIFLLLAKNKFVKNYYFMVNLILIISISLTGARSSYLGLIFSLMLLFLYTSFREKIFEKRKTFFLLLGILVLLFFIWPSHRDSEYKREDTKLITQSFLSKSQNLTLAAPKEALRRSYHQRLMAWTCGFENFAKNPVLGTGWGSWQLNYASCQGRLLKKYPALKKLKVQSNSAHNIFVETLAQSGLLGLFTFCVFLFFTFWSFKKYSLKEKNIKNKLFFLGIFAAMAGFLVDNILNITFQIQVVALIFYFYMGVLVSLTSEKRKVNVNIVKIFLILFALLFVICAFKQGGGFLSSYYSFRGYKEIKNNNLIDAKKTFEKAISLSDGSVDTYFAYFRDLDLLKDTEGKYNLLHQILTYYPFYYEFYNIKASLEANAGNFQQAFADLKTGLDLHPRYEPMFKILLGLLVNFKELRTLQNAAFVESLDLPMSYRNAYNVVLAQTYGENNLPQKARSILLEELSRNKYDKRIQENLLQLNKDLGIKEDAILTRALLLSDLRKKIMQSDKSNPALLNELKDVSKEEDLEGNMLLAQYYFKQKDYQKCREVLTNIYQKYSDFLPLNFAFASLEEVTGNKKEAKKYLLNILAQDENNDLALKRLQNIN